MVSTAFGSSTDIKMDSVIYGAEYFFFILQKDGSVAPLRAVFPNSLIAANYNKNEVSLNTIDIVFNPKLFKASSMRLGGYVNFSVGKSITLIRGLAVWLPYMKDKTNV
jgi:hypothetical protein